jgi:hypothetical protein
MCDLTNLVPWLALLVSLAAALFTGLASWISAEKLRLDLYDRRFDIYSRTLNLRFALDVWNPTSPEKASASLQGSPELDEAVKAFTKASRESQFLFDNDSGVHKRLEQMHSDVIAIIGDKRNVLPNLGGPDLARAWSEHQERLKRVLETVPPLEEAMKKYLNFHALYKWPRPWAH